MVIAAVCVVFGGAPADALGAATHPTSTLDAANIRITGSASLTAAAVEPAGDVNGDGRQDVLVYYHGGWGEGTPENGTAWVVFGQASFTTLSLDSLGSRGFRIDGGTSIWDPTDPSSPMAGQPFPGMTAKAAGDVNNDGLDDIVIGVPFFNAAGRGDAGAVWVVFGKAGTSRVDVESLGAGGFEIQGAAGYMSTGLEAAAAGDVNADGYDDVILQQRRTPGSGQMDAVVVYGADSTTTVDLAAPGSRAFKITNTSVVFSATRSVGVSLARAGDVNADGKSDLFVVGSCEGVGCSVDRSWVVFGKTGTTAVDVSSLGSGGYTIRDMPAGSATVARPAGDVNGDSVPDVIVGNVNLSPLGRDHAGGAYVLFGKSTTAEIDVDTLGSAGFAIYGPHADAWTGGVSPIGDFDDDGLDDVALSGSAAAYVVRGRTGGSVDLASFPGEGFRIVGAAGTGDVALVAGVRDATGSTRPGVAVLTTSGLTYFVTEIPPPTISYPAKVVYVRGTQIAPVDPTVSHATPASFSVTPALAAGLSIDTTNGSLTGTASATAPTTDHTVTIEANGSQAQTSLSVRVDTDIFAPTAPASGASLATAKPTFSWERAAQTDATDGILRYELWIDDTKQQDVSPQACTTACSVASSVALSEGDHTWRISALDTTGRIRSAAVRSVKIDTTAPDEFGLESPDAGSRLPTQQPRLQWQRSTDAGTGLAAYRLILDGRRVDLPPSETTYTPGEHLADGGHTWKVEAVDNVGNVRSSGTRTFVVDTTDPIPALHAMPQPASTGEIVTLDAGESRDPDGGHITRYEWDLDGDGRFESEGPSQAARTYGSRGTVTPAVRVTDQLGRTAVVITPIEIRLTAPNHEIGVSINNGDIATNNPKVRVSVVWPRLATHSLLSNDGGFGAAGGTTLLAVEPTLNWNLASSGPERLPKIVYLRFRGGAAGRETYTDDIILDQRRPRILALRSARRGASGAVAAGAVRKRRIRLRATDQNAGVAGIEVAGRNKKVVWTKRLAARSKRGKRKLVMRLAVKAPRGTYLVRVYDAAGNRSPWRRVSK